MATFHTPQAGPELAAACGTQANLPTYSGTSPGDRKWASRTRKTLDRLKEQFYWPGHFSDVHNC